MAQKAPYQAHRRAHMAKRRRDILQLYTDHPGWTYYELGKQLGIGARRVGELVREALKQAADDERNLAAVALQRSIRLHQAAMEAAWEIVQQPCGKCLGAGMVPDPDNPRTLDNTGAIIHNTVPCMLCEHGSGYAYPYQARLGALDRHQRAVEQLNKLLGLYEPDRVNVNVNFRNDLAALPLHELERMLDEYATGYTDALADHSIATAAEEEGVA